MNGELKNSLKLEEITFSSFKNLVSLKNPNVDEENLLMYTEFSMFSSFDKQPPTIFDPKTENFVDLGIKDMRNFLKKVKKMKKLKLNGKDRYFAIRDNSVCLLEFFFETSSYKIDLVFHNFLAFHSPKNLMLMDDLLLVENYQKFLIYRLENI